MALWRLAVLHMESLETRILETCVTSNEHLIIEIWTHSRKVSDLLVSKSGVTCWSSRIAILTVLELHERYLVFDTTQTQVLAVGVRFIVFKTVWALRIWASSSQPAVIMSLFSNGLFDVDRMLFPTVRYFAYYSCCLRSIL